MDRATYAREYYHKTKHIRKEKLKAYQDKYYATHKEEKVLRHKEWVKENKAHVIAYAKEYSLRKLYGLSLEQFNDMKQQQNNRCGICNCEFNTKNFPYVDHSHETGNVRGLLCSLCNLALGQFKDDEIYLSSAITYLRRYKNGIF